MSYRALVSIQSVSPSGEPLAAQSFRMTLDEDFKLGEEIAEKLGANRSYTEAWSMASTTLELLTMRFEDGLEREKWVEAYADQVWNIRFCESEGYTRVRIEGYDSGNTMIFFRSTVYG